MKTIRLTISGMHCGGCVNSVEKALLGVQGVREARVNLATETATIEIDTDGDATTPLIAAVRGAGYEAERARGATQRLTEIESMQTVRLQRQRQAMVQAIGLGLPIIALDLFGHSLQSADLGGHVWWRALQALLCTMLLASPAGAPILAGGFQGILRRSGNMDVLITLGVVAAYLSSVASIFLPGLTAHHFHSAAMILGFINIGKYLEARAKTQASFAASALARRVPKTAVRISDGGVETVALDQIEIGDRLCVAADTIVPVDGLVVEGTAAVDQSVMTGESMPVARRVGDDVFGGGIVREGTITIEATALGEDSAIAAIVRAVEEAQSGKTHMQRIADRVAGVFVPIVVVVSCVTMAGWLMAGRGGGAGLEATIAVLVIACPCAMGLATPTAVMVATGAAALRGILVRDAAALETLGAVDLILFDKTGTLTTGRPTVAEIIPMQSAQSAADVLQWSACVEQLSHHPLARAIVAEAARHGLSLSNPLEFESEAGAGVTAIIDHGTVTVGTATYLENRKIEVTTASNRAAAMTRNGMTLVYVAVDRELTGIIGLSDTIRDFARDAVSELHHLGISTAIVTGDSAEAAQSVAQTVGIEDVASRLLPRQKMDEVIRRQSGWHGLAQQGRVLDPVQRHGLAAQDRATQPSTFGAHPVKRRRVAFVGDGINDAPALAAADVGIAFAAGTDIANAAADITLVGDDLRLVPAAVRIARRSVRIIRQNLFWAFFYNTAAIPLAAVGRIPPSVAAAAMMISSLTVVLNSLRLRSVKSPEIVPIQSQADEPPRELFQS